MASLTALPISLFHFLSLSISLSLSRRSNHVLYSNISGCLLCLGKVVITLTQTPTHSNTRHTWKGAYNSTHTHTRPRPRPPLTLSPPTRTHTHTLHTLTYHHTV